MGNEETKNLIEDTDDSIQGVWERLPKWEDIHLDYFFAVMDKERELGRQLTKEERVNDTVNNISQIQS